MEQSELEMEQSELEMEQSEFTLEHIKFTLEQSKFDFDLIQLRQSNYQNLFIQSKTDRLKAFSRFPCREFSIKLICICE